MAAAARRDSRPGAKLYALGRLKNASCPGSAVAGVVAAAAVVVVEAVAVTASDLPSGSRVDCFPLP